MTEPIAVDFNDTADDGLLYVSTRGLTPPAVGETRWFYDAEGNRARGVVQEVLSPTLVSAEIDWETWVPRSASRHVFVSGFVFTRTFEVMHTDFDYLFTGENGVVAGTTSPASDEPVNSAC